MRYARMCLILEIRLFQKQQLPFSTTQTILSFHFPSSTNFAGTVWTGNGRHMNEVKTLFFSSGVWWVVSFSLNTSSFISSINFHETTHNHFHQDHKECFIIPSLYHCFTITQNCFSLSCVFVNEQNNGFPLWKDSPISSPCFIISWLTCFHYLGVLKKKCDHWNQNTSIRTTQLHSLWFNHITHIIPTSFSPFTPNSFNHHKHTLTPPLYTPVLSPLHYTSSAPMTRELPCFSCFGSNPITMKEKPNPTSNSFSIPHHSLIT